MIGSTSVGLGGGGTATEHLSSSVIKHDDSMFSAPADSPSMFRQGGVNNPFGDTKNSLIKKINTEAYLVQPDAVAKYTAGQQAKHHPSLLLNAQSRHKTQMETMVLNGVPQAEISIDITPAKRA